MYQLPEESDFVDEYGNAHTRYTASHYSPQYMSEEYTLVDCHINDDVHVGDMVDINMIYSLIPESTYAPEKLYTSQDTAHINAKVRIGALIYSDSFEITAEKAPGEIYFVPHFPYWCFTTIQGLATMGLPAGYTKIEIFLKDGITTEENRFLRAELTNIAYRIPYAEVSGSATELNKVGYELYLMNRITGYSIVLLLVFITVLMLINFVNAQLNTNKRSIGILRAVGTSRRALNKIYLIEITRLFVPSVVVGALLAGVFRVFFPPLLMYIEIGEVPLFWERISRITFPIWELGVFCIALYATAVITLLIMMRSQLKQNVIDNIRTL